jgi:hypothetical protein
MAHDLDAAAAVAAAVVVAAAGLPDALLANLQKRDPCLTSRPLWPLVPGSWPSGPASYSEQTNLF